MATARRCWLWLLLCLVIASPSFTEACAHPFCGVRVSEASNPGPGHAFDDPEAGIWEYPADDDHAALLWRSEPEHGTSLQNLGHSWQDLERAYPMHLGSPTSSLEKVRVWGLRGIALHFERQFIQPLIPEGRYKYFPAALVDGRYHVPNVEELRLS